MPLPPITIYRTASGVIAQRGEDCFLLAGATMDEVFTQSDPLSWLEPQLSYGQPIECPPDLLPPIGGQELRLADGPGLPVGGGIVAPGAAFRLNADAKWNGPQAALALAVNSRGSIFGYTIGNQIFSRDDDPGGLVSPWCCALGPGIVVREPLPGETGAGMRILRAGTVAFSGAAPLPLKNIQFDDSAASLPDRSACPSGWLILISIGILPPDDFTLQPGDRIATTISSVGTLRNVVG